MATLPVMPGLADDEDVPKREPTLAWEMEVPCDSAADLADLADPSAAPRRCSIDVAGDALYLLEHTTEGAPGPFRLTRFDIATGDEQWVSDVGPSATLEAHDDIVVVSDKNHFEVYDAATGEQRFERDGAVSEVNRYGTLLLTDGSVVTAFDPVTGDVRWEADGDLGTYCRDIVIVVATATAASEPFAVLDHYSGEARWTSPENFDPRTQEVTCGFGPYVYTTDEDELHEWSAYDGWLNWSVAVAEPGHIEVYREVALVRSGSESIVAVERDTGQVAWERPATEVGTAVSIIGRVREDAEGVFTLHPLTGDIINYTSPTPGSDFEVVTASDTRLVVASGAVVTAYGMNDLGVSWQLDVGGTPDEFVVSTGELVVRTGAALRGYR